MQWHYLAYCDHSLTTTRAKSSKVQKFKNTLTCLRIVPRPSTEREGISHTAIPLLLILIPPGHSMGNFQKSNGFVLSGNIVIEISSSMKRLNSPILGMSFRYLFVEAFISTWLINNIQRDPIVPWARAMLLRRMGCIWEFEVLKGD